MATHKELLKAEKKALNKLFVRELSNVRKETHELDQLQKAIVVHVNYGNSKDRTTLEQKYVDSQVVDLLNQYRKKIDDHLPRLRRVKQIEKDIDYAKKYSYYQGSHTFKRLNYEEGWATWKLENAEGIYYPPPLKKYIERLNTTYDDVHLNTVIPVHPMKNKLYPGTYTKNNSLSRRVLHTQKARLNKEVKEQIKVIEISKKELDKATTSILSSCENIGKTISELEALEYQNLCVKQSECFVTYIDQFVALDQVRTKLHQTRIALVHHTSLNTENKIKYINASQTLKKVNYTQDSFAGNLQLALKKYQSPQILEFYDVYTNRSSRERIAKALKKMGKLLAKVDKEKEVVENTQPPKIQQETLNHPVIERAQSNQSINSRRLGVVINQAVANSTNESYIKRNRETAKKVDQPDRSSML